MPANAVPDALDAALAEFSLQASQEAVLLHSAPSADATATDAASVPADPDTQPPAAVSTVAPLFDADSKVGEDAAMNAAADHDVAAATAALRDLVDACDLSSCTRKEVADLMTIFMSYARQYQTTTPTEDVPDFGAELAAMSDEDFQEAAQAVGMFASMAVFNFLPLLGVLLEQIPLYVTAHPDLDKRTLTRFRLHLALLNEMRDHVAAGDTLKGFFVVNRLKGVGELPADFAAEYVAPEVKKIEDTAQEMVNDAGESIDGAAPDCGAM
jgi:hypothetical protein